MKMSRYGKSIGKWHLTVGDADLDLEVKVGDNLNFSEIVMGKKYKDDTLGRMKAFNDFMFEIIRRSYPDDNESEQKKYVEFNSVTLQKQVMIDFNWTTAEALDASEKEELDKIKKSIREN